MEVNNDYFAQAKLAFANAESRNDFEFFSYSYANAVGSALQEPYITMLSSMAVVASKPWEGIALQCAKVALIILLTAPLLLFYIPAVAGENICFWTHTHIVDGQIKLTHPPIQTGPETLYRQNETFEIKMCRHIHAHKESLVLETFQNDKRALSYVRSALGEELGLNATDGDKQAALQMPWAGFVKYVAESVFLMKYKNVNRLVEAVQTMINAHSFDPCYREELIEKMGSDYHIQNPNDYVQKHFFSQDLKLNEKGAHILLSSMCIFLNMFYSDG